MPTHYVPTTLRRTNNPLPLSLLLTPPHLKMEPTKVNFDYSLKNIPLPKPESHVRAVINKTEQFLQRIRWKVHFFFNPPKPQKDNKKSVKTETYGFNTTHNAPQHATLAKFEEDLTHLISNLEYTNKRTPFQDKLITDANNIRKSKHIYVTADKTRNIYKVDKPTYNKLIRDNITSHYEKTTSETLDTINNNAKKITDTLKISDRVEPIANKSCYITIKDHKEDFPSNVKCRLINPAKSNIGIIGKQIISKINETIRTKLKLQQWRCTSDMLDWFKNLENKPEHTLLQLDIVDFYPSITEQLFDTALTFAKTITPISNLDINILHNARQSILFHNNEIWRKKQPAYLTSQWAHMTVAKCVN